MKPYYILNALSFDVDAPSFSSTQQQSLEGTVDAIPGSIFKKKPIQELRDFIKYDLENEVTKNKRGRAYGKHEFFDCCILVEENTLYYDIHNDIVLVCAPKDLFKKFQQNISTAANRNFKLESIPIDFYSIVANRHSLGIKSIWLGELPDMKVESLALIGSQVQSSDHYKQLIASGAKITNISIVFEHLDKQERVMITKEGGIILYSSADESDELLLVKAVYEKLLKKDR